MNNSDTSAYRKALLYRRANGRKIISSHLHKVAEICPSSDHKNLISLEETDSLLVEFNSRRTALLEFRRRISPHEIQEVLETISKTYKGGAYIFIDEDWRYCGALRIAESWMINKEFRFGPKIINDLIFIDVGMEKAISLDYFEINGDTLVDVIEWEQ